MRAGTGVTGWQLQRDVEGFYGKVCGVGMQDTVVTEQLSDMKRTIVALEVTRLFNRPFVVPSRSSLISFISRSL